MSAARMDELALKKRMLQQRSEVLRHTLAIQLGDTLGPAAGFAERAAATGRWLRRHSAWLVAGAVALMVWKPKALPNLAGRTMWAWQTWQRWQPFVLPVLMPLIEGWRAAAANPGTDGPQGATHDQDGTDAPTFAGPSFSEGDQSSG